ncbi:MAG: hypothetical protein K9N46_03145 [Candidatus Marinimicrobia bacterium]|nr:hypothetical protein [Candidatus Neomarinimicrobiota bacterium]MCF7828106.1 hypothetical protein [Candidatus Neomarinimicrobiota bacterium]MCF7879719.1 hypothetical protein [Candidatus Neomarinimicrobiota bacterium]
MISCANKSIFPVLFILLFPGQFLTAAGTNFVPEYLTINDGLSSNYITDIHKDPSGYMWFGTMDGLNRYDGYSFLVFRNMPNDEESLLGNRITAIEEDHHGNFFIGTTTPGLNYFYRNSTRVKRIPLADSTGRVFSSVHTIKCANDSLVWLGTIDGCIIRFNSIRDSIEWYTRIPSDFPNGDQNTINGFYPDSTENLYIASEFGGLDCLPSTRSAITHILPADTLDEEFRRNGCRGIIEARDGNLWIARAAGVTAYNPRTTEIKQFSFADGKGEMLKARNLQINRDGKIILSSYHDLLMIDPVTGTHTNITSVLPQYFTSALLVDENNIIWAGTNGYGGVKIDPRKSRFHNSTGSFLPEVFGEQFSALSGYPGVNQSLRDMNFLSVIRDRHSNLWAATQFSGLYKVEHETAMVRIFRMGTPDLRGRYQVMYEVYEGQDGRIWVSTVGGISLLDEKNGSFTYFRLYPGKETASFALNSRGYFDISCMYQDRNGTFWLGTPELGLLSFHPVTTSGKNIPVIYGISGKGLSFPILTIAEDPTEPDDYLWLETEGNGLVQFDKRTEEMSFFNTGHGLPNNIVNGILTDARGHLWMSTNRGICTYDPVGERFAHYDKRDGLQSNGFNRREFYKTADGEMYFGGVYGYNHFHPGDVLEVTEAPPIVLTGVKLLNTPLDIGAVAEESNHFPPLENRLVLKHHQNKMITFNYTALAYTDAHRIRYAYKLEDFDRSWINNGPNRSAVYTNLNPGEYLFRVRQYRDITNPEAPELTLALTILPSAWGTWWFRLLLSAAFVGLISMYFLVRQKNLVAKTRQQQRFAQQLILAQERERKRIASELHDGLGQNLLIIKNKLMAGLKTPYGSDKQVNFITEASDLTSRTLEEVRTISQGLHPSYLEYLGLTMALESTVDHVSEAPDMTFHVEIENIDGIVSREKEINIYRIIQESMNNILRHSGAAEVLITAKKTDAQVVIRVEDNGRGFNFEKTVASRRGLGIGSMFERSMILGATFTIDSSPGSGTKISLTIPVEGTSHDST